MSDEHIVVERVLVKEFTISTDRTVVKEPRTTRYPERASEFIDKENITLYERTYVEVNQEGRETHNKRVSQHR